MALSAAIDTAIGIVLMYFVLSLVCTVINEYVATWTNLRAATLERALTELVDEPKLHADFYDHGLIDGAIAAKGGHVSYLSPSTFASALIGSLDPTHPVPDIASVSSAVQHMPDSNVRDALLAHLAASGGNLDKLRANIAEWFDHAMDRVSGVYKRHMKLISLLVGFGLALVINADTIKVGRALWHDGSLRALAVSDAGRAIAGTAALPPPAPGSTSAVQVIDAIRNAETQLRPLPLGWNFSSPILKASWLARLWFGMLKLLGLVLTAIALSLGAPFWFDLLSKFMNLRGTGPKPDS